MLAFRHTNFLPAEKTSFVDTDPVTQNVEVDEESFKLPEAALDVTKTVTTKDSDAAMASDLTTITDEQADDLLDTLGEEDEELGAFLQEALGQTAVSTLSMPTNLNEVALSLTTQHEDDTNVDPLSFLGHDI
jgi:hypothetical protein